MYTHLGLLYFLPEACIRYIERVVSCVGRIYSSEGIVTVHSDVGNLFRYSRHG